MQSSIVVAETSVEGSYSIPNKGKVLLVVIEFTGFQITLIHASCTKSQIAS